MNLADTIRAALAGPLGQAAASALPGILERVLPGGIQALLDQLQRSGYQAQVNSWLGRGPNQPITPDDLRRVLGSTQAQQLAERLGIPPEQFLELLAKMLPATVDSHSPDGTLKPPAPAA